MNSIRTSVRLRFTVLLGACLLSAFIWSAHAQGWVADPAKVEEVLSKMTLEEKLDEISLDGRSTKPNTRLGIPPTRGVNGPRGPGRHFPSHPVNVNYPVALAMAATWDEPLMDTLGKQWGLAMIESSVPGGQGRNNIFGTGVNTCRHPLAGRNAEYFGEDPVLSGKVAAALTRGVQSQGSVATIKHFAGNDFENGRNIIDIKVSDRVLRELILKPFEICIKEGNALGIMTGYNKLNGTFCSANTELLRILREDFGFKGIVVSDFGANMVNATTSLNAGSHLENFTKSYYAADKVKKALDSGELKPEVLDQRIREILQVKLAPAYYDASKPKEPLTNIEVRHDLARKVATESFVLLKNEGNLLPLSPSSSIALIGPFADSDAIEGNQGSSTVRGDRFIGLKEEFEKRFSGGVTTVSGCGPADKGDGVGRTDFASKAEYFNNLDLQGEPALVRNEKSIQKLSFKEGGVAQLVDEGVFGKALLFAGQSSIKLGQLPGWNAKEDYTINFWVNYIDQFPKEDGVIFSLPSAHRTTFHITPKGLIAQTGGSDRNETKLKFEIPSLKWVNVTISRKDGKLTAYIDGKPVAKGEMDFAYPATPLFIGSDGKGRQGGARAMIEDVRIYNRALSDEQIQGMANKKVVNEGLAFHAPCNQAVTSSEDETYPGIENSKNMSARWTGTFTPKTSGKHCFEFLTSGGLRVFINGKKLIDQWSEQMATGNTLMIWPVLEAGKNYDLRVEFTNCARRGELLLFNHYAPVQQDLFAEARAAAKKSDVAVVVVGVHQTLLQGESNDNETFELPGYQSELIEAVASANPKTVVLLCTAGGVAMKPWISKVPAVMELFFPGQEAGNSVADVLLGEVNPSGKLPMTYPESVDQIPNTVADPVYPDDLCHYGYFLFDKKNLTPEFPFGHGLSYTTFGYENMKLSRANGQVKVSFTLKNTGKREGAEVAQVYVGPDKPQGDRPIRMLEGFKKVWLKPGESKEVEVMLPEESLTQWDTAQKKWIPLPGELKVEVGSSSRDIRASRMVSIK